MKKKNLMLMAILISLSGTVFAQFGAHVGATFSSTKVEEDYGGETESQKYGTLVSPNFGVFYRAAMGSGGTFAIQPELNYMRKGGRENLEIFEETIKTSIILNYIELPVYFLYNGAQPSGFYGGIGPAFNFGMSGKVKASYDGESESEDLNFGKDEDLKGFHMAINGLVGYQLESGININAFLSQSITNSATDMEDGDGGEGKISFFNFGLRVGYVIGAGSEAKAKVRLKPTF